MVIYCTPLYPANLHIPFEKQNKVVSLLRHVTKGAAIGEIEWEL